MKIRLFVLILICTVLCFTGCGESEPENNTTDVELSKNEIETEKETDSETEKNEPKTGNLDSELTSQSPSDIHVSDDEINSPSPSSTPVSSDETDTVAYEDFKDTMYDYHFAGIKSAEGRVDPADYISVSDYGVLPDSEADYSDIIIRAVMDAASKGKYLYFPEGTYHVKNVKVENVKNAMICGAGEKTVLMTADDAVGEVKWDIAVGLYNCDNCVVRDITFDGNNGKVAGDTSVGVLQLRIDNCENASVFGCRFQNNNSGNINVVGQAEGLKIYYCDFLNSDCSIVVMPGYITNGYICNNFIDGQDWIWSEPISLYNAPDDDKPNSNVVISGNDIRNHTQTAGGVFITYPSKDIYVLSNYFYRCGAAVGSGSRLQSEEDDRGPWDVVCRDNVIESPTWHGFGLLYAKGWMIENNTITDITDGFAFYLDQCYDNTIKDNSIDGSRVYQVDCSGNVVMRNK